MTSLSWWSGMPSRDDQRSIVVTYVVQVLMLATF
jgi:hypothetical protein